MELKGEEAKQQEQKKRENRGKRWRRRKQTEIKKKKTRRNATEAETWHMLPTLFFFFCSVPPSFSYRLRPSIQPALPMASPNNPGPGKKLPRFPTPTLSPAPPQGQGGPATPPPGLQRLMPLQQHPTQAHPSMGQMSPTQFQGQGGVVFNQANQMNQMNQINNNNTSFPQEPLHDTLHRQLLAIVNNRQGKLHRDVNGIIQSKDGGPWFFICFFLPPGLLALLLQGNLTVALSIYLSLPLYLSILDYNASMEQDMSFIVNTFIQTKADLERVQQENTLLQETKNQAAAEIARLREAGGKANLEIGRLNEAGNNVQRELINLRRLYQLLYNCKLTLAGAGRPGEGVLSLSGAVVSPWNNPNQPIPLDNPSLSIQTTIPTAIQTTIPTATSTATPTISSAVNGPTSFSAAVTSPVIGDGSRIIELDSPEPDTVSFEDEPAVMSDIEMVSKELIRATEDIATLKNENQELLDRLEVANRRGDDLEQALITKQGVNKSLADLYESRNRSLTEKSVQVEQMRTQLEQAKADLTKFYGLMSTATANLKSAHNFMFTHYGALAKSVAEKQKQQGSQSPGVPTQPLSPSSVQTADSVLRTLETSALETAKAASNVQDSMRPACVNENHPQTQQLSFPPVGSFGSSAPAPPPVHTFRPTKPANPPLLQQQGSMRSTVGRPPTPTQATPILVETPFPTLKTPARPQGQPQGTPWRPPGTSSGRPPAPLQSLGPAVHSFNSTTPPAPGGQAPSQPSTAGIHSFKPTKAGRSVASSVAPPQHAPGPLPALGTFKSQSIQPKMASSSTVIDLTSTDNLPVVSEPRSSKAGSQPATGGTSAPTSESGTSPSFVKQPISDSTEPIVTPTFLQHASSGNASRATTVSVTGQTEQRSGKSDAGKSRVDPNNKQKTTTPPNKVSKPSDGQLAWMATRAETTASPPPTPASAFVYQTTTKSHTDTTGPSSASSGPDVNVRDNITELSYSSSTTTLSPSSGAATTSSTHSKTSSVSTGASILTDKLFYGAKVNERNALSSTTALPPSAVSSARLPRSPFNETEPAADSKKKVPRTDAEKHAKAERVVAARKRIAAKAKAFEEMLAVTESKNQSHGGNSGSSSGSSISPVSKAASPIQSEKVEKSKADLPLEDDISGEDGQSPSSSLLPPPPSSTSSPRSSSRTKILETQPAIIAKEVETATLVRKSSFVKLPGRFYLSAVEIPVRKNVQSVKSSSGTVRKKTPVKAPAKRKWTVVSDSDDDY